MNEQYTQRVDKSTLQRLKEHLQKKDAQKRILQRMQDARSKATVSISRAASLFDLSENQLRDWERRGLLKTERTIKEDSKGHRQYTPNELDKLALIKELLDQGDFALSDIPLNVDDIWDAIRPPNGRQAQLVPQTQAVQQEITPIDLIPINRRIYNAREELFLRFYASRALRLSLLLISDELPNNTAGLLLPLQPDFDAASVQVVNDIENLGESLVGWLSKSRSSHTLLTPRPSLDYKSDYILLPLAVMSDDKPLEPPQDNTRIILERPDRRPRWLTLNAATIETIRHLLAPVYEDAQKIRTAFGPGMCDDLDPAPNLDNTVNTDMILDGLANMIVRLGGKTKDGLVKWRFSCILLPKDLTLPLQQRTLVVRARSQLSPHKIGGSTVSPDKSANSISLRAYQSGYVIYRANITDTDVSIAYRYLEGDVRSAIAVPIGGENGPVVAVLYVASYEPEAFTESDQRVLRMVGRMIEEIIWTYRIRQQVTGRLINAIERPRSVDPLFEDFLSENGFVHDVEDLLATLKAQLGHWEEPLKKEEPLEERKARSRKEQLTSEVVSFIAIGIDNQSSLATKYGDQVARNLSKEVGLRIQNQQRLVATPEYLRLYHIFADRYYLMLKGMTLEETRAKAEQLKKTLDGDYRVNARSLSADQLMLPERKLELKDVTVRLGVLSFAYGKLKELLQRYDFEPAVAHVRAIIMCDLDEILMIGQQEGGNVIMSWDIDSWSHRRLFPSR